jgi:hypothetical protein
MMEELDLEIDSFVRTAKGGVVIVAKDRLKNKFYRIGFNRGDYEWIVGKT